MPQALDEYSRTVFALINAMLQIKANEMLDDIVVKNADGDTVKALQNQAEGLGRIIAEVKTVKGLK